MSKNMYQRMKEKGINMAWYERGKSRSTTAIPLDDEECSKYSIYLMKADGTLWTLDRGLPHKKVRETGKQLAAAQYVCMHTKAGYATYEEAVSHSNCKEKEVR